MNPDRPKTRRIPARKICAEVVFDTADSSLREGIRSRERTDRHLLFRGGGHFVDVRLAPAKRGEPKSIVGQVGSAALPSAPVADLPMRMAGDSGRARTTRTNERGEFRIGGPIDRTTRLLFHLSREEQLEIPLGATLGLDG